MPLAGQRVARGKSGQVGAGDAAAEGRGVEEEGEVSTDGDAGRMSGPERYVPVGGRLLCPVFTVH